MNSRGNVPLSFTGGKHHSVLTGRANSKDRWHDSKGHGSRTENGPVWSLTGGGRAGGDEKAEALWKLECKC